MKKATIICIIILSINHCLFSQSLNSVLVSKDTLAYTKSSFKFLDESPRDGMTTIRLMFYFYKSFISSQDVQSCRFSPSCSEYAFQSMKKHGLIHGLIDFWDRFSRCNPLSSENYKYDTEKKLFLDPVE